MTLIVTFLLATWAIYVFIPNRGATGVVASGVIVAGFLSLVYLTKYIILLT